MGLAIAAPVGPIGMLCIRRTLQSGAAVGLASGLGAAAADALYGAAVAGGFAITGWLVSHSRLLSALGSILLVGLGLSAIHAFFGGSTTREGGPAGQPAAKTGLPRALVSTFALTLANPATIVSFVAVIAAFGSASNGSNAAFTLVAGVFLGSMLWWTALVTCVGAARRLVSPALLRSIDLATGLILLGSGACVGGRTLLAAA
jgi:threonine/homoserine/homoserine lactone efflux protein